MPRPCSRGTSRASDPCVDCGHAVGLHRFDNWVCACCEAAENVVLTTAAMQAETTATRLEVTQVGARLAAAEVLLEATAAALEVCLTLIGIGGDDEPAVGDGTLTGRIMAIEEALS